MGSTTVQAPAPRNVGQEGRETLQAQIDLAPAQLAAYQQTAGGYADVDRQNLFNSFTGDNGILALNRILAGDTAEANRAANSAQRAADFNDLSTYGGSLLNLQRSLNSEMYGGMDAYGARATRGVDGTAAGTQAAGIGQRGFGTYNPTAVGGVADNYNVIQANSINPSQVGASGVGFSGINAGSGIGFSGVGAERVGADGINAGPGVGFSNVGAERVGYNGVNAGPGVGVGNVNARGLGFNGVQAGSVGYNSIDPQNVSGSNISANNVMASTGFDAVRAARGDMGLGIAAGRLAQGTGPGAIQQTLEGQAMGDLSLGGRLSEQETRDAQQAARAAYAARGLGDTNASVAAEVLNLDNAQRARQNERRAFAAGVDQQGFGQRQQDFGNSLAFSGQAQNYGQQSLAAQQANLGAQLQGNQQYLQSGLANQQANLTAAQSNQANAMQAGLANQQVNYNAQLANQNAGLRAGEFNASQSLAAQQANQAAGLRAGETTLNADLQAQLANQSANLAAGQFNAGQSMEAQRLNQAAALQSGLANQQLAYNAQLANQNAGLQAGQFNAQMGYNAQAANQAAALQAALANQQYGYNSQLANQNAGLQAAQFNAGQSFDAQRLNQAAGIQTGLFNSQQSLAAQQANQAAGMQADMFNTEGFYRAQLANQQDAYQRAGLNANINQFNSQQGQNAYGMNMQALQNQFGMLMSGDAQEVDRQRQNNQMLQNYVGMRQNTQFDPALGILGRQSINQGTTAGLFGQGQGAMAGSNAETRNQFNPFNSYASDVYSTNYNGAFNANAASAANNTALIGAGLGAAGKLGGAFIGRPCWVAREVYGVNNPRWMIFREWLFNFAPESLRSAYLANGERLAYRLHNKPRLKAKLLAWMEAQINTMEDSYAIRCTAAA